MDYKAREAVTYAFHTPSISLNDIRIPRGNRLISSPDYRRWQVVAGAELIGQGVKPVASPVEVLIQLPKSCLCDADNTPKAWLDLLVTHKAIQNDSKKHVRRVITEHGNGDKTVIMISPVD